MKSTVETLSPTRVKLAVEVPFEEIKPSFDAAYKRLGSQVRIPGFRPGKVPGRILEQRLGRGAVLEEVVNDALPKAYSDAVDANELRPLTQPEVAITEVGDTSFQFTAEVDIRPEFEIPDFSSVVVSIDDVVVDDEEVDQQVASLRERFSTLKGVERKAENGDFVSIDLLAKVEDEEIEGGSTQGMSYEIGSGQLIDGLDEALVGMDVDEEKSFQTELVAGEQAGQSADVTVTVRNVKEKELPELDDEFAQMGSEFDTLAELREDLREKLARVKDLSRVSEARDKVMEALIEQTEIPVPDGALKGEIDARTHDAIHSFDHDEDAFAGWLTEQGKTREEFDEETKTNAIKSIKAQLLLDSIAEKDQIAVDESELTQYLIQQAQRYNMAPQQFADELQKANQVPALYADVRRNKALSTVLAGATVNDEAGNKIDLEAIQAAAAAAMGQTMEMEDPDEVDELEIDEDADLDSDLNSDSDSDSGTDSAVEDDTDTK